MKTLLSILFLVFVTPIFAETAEEAYQADAAAKRIADIHKIAAVLDEYKLTKGVLPLSEFYTGSATPHAIAIGSKSAEDREFTHGSPWGVSLRKFRTAMLIERLETGLEHGVVLPIDPQKIPTGFPNVYYLFMLEDEEYVILCFLASENTHSVEVANGVHIYALTSDPDMVFMNRLGLNYRFVRDVPQSELDEILAEGDRANAIFARYTKIEIGIDD